MGGRGVVGRSSFASSNLSFDTPEHDRDSALAIARVHPPQHQPQQLHMLYYPMQPWALQQQYYSFECVRGDKS